MMKRKRKFSLLIDKFPDRADFYRNEIINLENELKAIKACLRCGRPLKGDESQERGYGPECAKKEEVVEILEDQK